MTNEQHIENLKKLKSFHNGSYGPDIDRAIKALEEPKTDILDKIRAEILSRDEKVRAIRTDGHCFFTADEIIEIIDKYRQEGI